MGQMSGNGSLCKRAHRKRIWKSNDGTHRKKGVWNENDLCLEN